MIYIHFVDSLIAPFVNVMFQLLLPFNLSQFISQIIIWGNYCYFRLWRLLFIALQWSRPYRRHSRGFGLGWKTSQNWKHFLVGSLSWNRVTYICVSFYSVKKLKHFLRTVSMMIFISRLVVVQESSSSPRGRFPIKKKKLSQTVQAVALEHKNTWTPYRKS